MEVVVFSFALVFVSLVSMCLPRFPFLLLLVRGVLPGHREGRWLLAIIATFLTTKIGLRRGLGPQHGQQDHPWGGRADDGNDS